MLFVEYDEILIFANFVPTVHVDASKGVHADPSACTMGFGDISHLGICAEVLNWKAQPFLAEEQLRL